MAAISRDGARIAYWGVDDEGEYALYAVDHSASGLVRKLDDLGLQSRLVFSPDGNWVAYMKSNAIHRVPVGGGAAIRIVGGVSDLVGLWWDEDGFIYYTPDYGRGIYRAGAMESADEGEVVTRIDPEASEVGHVCSQLLPGGAKLITSVYGDGFKIATIDLRSGQHRIIIPGAQCPGFIEPNILLYVQGPSLMAAEFNPISGELGRNLQVADDLNVSVLSFAPNYSFSARGDLLYVSGTGNWDLKVLRRNFDGTEIEIRFNQPDLVEFAVSPNGRYLLGAGGTATADSDIYRFDLESGDRTQLTFHGAWDGRPVWLPDSRSFLFSSERDGHADIYRMDVATLETELVFQGANQTYVSDVTTDGRYAAFMEDTDDRSEDSRAVSLVDPTDIVTIAASPFSENEPNFSPDGNWVAYQSNRSGTAEIYVVSFPDVGEPVRISASGGQSPEFSPDGAYVYFVDEKELFRRRFIEGRPVGNQEKVLSDVRTAWTLAYDGTGVITHGPPPFRTFRLIKNWKADFQRRLREMD